MEHNAFENSVEPQMDGPATEQPQTVEQVPDGDDRHNPQDDPGGNYIDADDRSEPPHPSEQPATDDAPPPSGADHFGQDGSRSTMTAEESQRELGDAAEQSVPAMSQNNATVDEKLMGIVEQTISDAELQPRERLERHLRERINDSGLEVSDDEIRAAVAKVEAALPEEG